MLLRRVILLAIGLSILMVVACSQNNELPINAPATDSTSSKIQAPEFDVDSFVELKPNPEIRELDPEIDLGFYERERIPRDAIEPIYTPKFVTPNEVTLQPDEIVMGLIINGDARAYPTGLLRVREMVNDDVGGTPVLVSW